MKIIRMKIYIETLTAIFTVKSLPFKGCNTFDRFNCMATNLVSVHSVIWFLCLQVLDSSNYFFTFIFAGEAAIKIFVLNLRGYLLPSAADLRRGPRGGASAQRRAAASSSEGAWNIFDYIATMAR